MGLEDREWRREELRQQGHKASWDGFKAKGSPPKSEPNRENSSTPGSSDANDEIYDKSRLDRIRGILNRSGVVKPAVQVKKRTPPSYVHLQAQEILDSRSGGVSYLWPVIVCVSAFAAALGYAYFSP